MNTTPEAQQFLAILFTALVCGLIWVDGWYTDRKERRARKERNNWTKTTNN